MSDIHIKNLTFGYQTGDNVFENLNLSINSNLKLGLTGINGQGKSTLFKLLLNKFEYSGNIQSTISFVHFPLQINNKQIIVNDLTNAYIGHKAAKMMKRSKSLEARHNKGIKSVTY
ncbi:ATP-binding cassette domain-containing protein [Mollicutes bacterium LVI A0078]|nr:ATP-binding cassette domain-containing protein [Mollicutes bacterium LVI A0075]WOO90969.1 ATP-binding cassette domain-containing protein [Mollicutes bacterium LVI A0078]